MATRNKTVFRGVFERIDDKAHCRIRLVSRDAQKTRALPGTEFEVGHVERTLFYSRRPEDEASTAEMRFGLWLSYAANEHLLVNVTDAELAHWRQFRKTRIYGPTVEIVE